MVKKKIGIVLAMLSAVVVLSISLVAAKNASQGDGSLEQTTLQVSNLSCGSCLATIEGELRKVNGMVEMSADLSRGLVTVGHTPALVKEQIALVITEAGYPAKVLSSAELAGKNIGQGSSASSGSGCGSGRGCGSGGCGLTPPVNAPQGPKS
jgi:copper chaperone